MQKVMAFVVSMAVLGCFWSWTASSQSLTSISVVDVRVHHKVAVVEAKFERYTGALEKILGRFAPDALRDVADKPQLAQRRVAAMAGAEGLMIFSVFDHGSALNIVGAPRKANQYLIGNPLTAIQMTRHDLRAALYAPLRVLVYEDSQGRTVIEYDQPSSLFGQFGNVEVTAVAQSLDEKLERALARAAQLSGD